MEPTPQLVFEIPDASAPGFLRRQRAAAQHLATIRSGFTAAALDSMLTFLLGFVAEPLDREQARELLLDLSREDYNSFLKAVLAENDSFLP